MNHAPRSSPSASRQAAPDPSKNIGEVQPGRGISQTLYVDTTGAVVRRRSGHFHVDRHTSEGTEMLARVPVTEVDAIVLVGKVHCTSAALHLCLETGIQLVILAWHGRMKGRVQGLAAPNVEVRLGQYRTLSNPERRMRIARAIVGAKLANMGYRLRRRAERQRPAPLRAAATSIEKLSRRLDAVQSREALMGLEGAATNAYFSVWDDILTSKDPELRFEKRSRRPPGNAVNALLGFCYRLLQKDVHAACCVAGLDPYLGVLHTPRPRTPSAVLDLMEAFRPALADSVVLAMVNRGSIRARHFEARDGGVYLNEEGRKAVYRAYGQARARDVTATGASRTLPYYRIFELHARRLARSVRDGSPYRGFRFT